MMASGSFKGSRGCKASCSSATSNGGDVAGLFLKTGEKPDKEVDWDGMSGLRNGVPVVGDWVSESIAGDVGDLEGVA
jgi:hypothetical protein